MADLVLRGPKVYTPEGIIESGWVAIEQGHITGIGSGGQASVCDLRFPSSYHLIPGMIDLHVHGARGCDVMDGSEEALVTISRALAQEGVTGFLATTMTEASARITEAIKTVTHLRQVAKADLMGADILGLHLEGPFVAPAFCGAQDPKHILAPDPVLLRQWQDLAQGGIKLITLAPETDQALPFIAAARDLGILVSLGHTGASYQCAKAAIDAGASYATHLFNAMSGVHHREPGVAMAILEDERVSAELIADGLHIHPDVIGFTLRLKGWQKVLLVTDAMRAKCLGTGVFDLGGQDVTVREDGSARLLKDGKLAGSILTMIKAVENLMNFTGCTLFDALHLVIYNQRRLLCLADRGAIQYGQRGDIVVLNEQFEVVLTVKAGAIIYKI